MNDTEETIISILGTDLKRTDRRMKPSALIVDPTMQRELVPARLNKIIKEWTPVLADTITVSRRDSGQYVILDGQHRWKAAEVVADEDFEFDVRIFHHLTRQQEAALFLGLNDAKPVHPTDKWRMQVEAGDPDALRMHKLLVEEHGLNITAGVSSTSPQGFAAIGTANRIAAWPNGIDTLDETLSLIANLYPDTKGRANPYKSPIVEGIALLIHRYGRNLNRAHLAERIGLQGSNWALVLMNNANTQQGTNNGGSKAHNVAIVLTAWYNQNRPRNTPALPAWQVRRRIDSLARDREADEKFMSEID